VNDLSKSHSLSGMSRRNPKLEAQVLIPVLDTPDAFAVSLKREPQLWADVIRSNMIVAV
jgi:hypothetical protein